MQQQGLRLELEGMDRPTSV